MQTTRIAVVLAMVGWLVSCGGDPATKPSVSGEEQGVAKPVSATDYGRELSRHVDRDDEIVAILENGMTVIARRVASPAVSVRGYVWAGAIYEGKWLGGGLSHLLEHLVAGGTNGRRTEEQNKTLLQQIGNSSNAFTTPDRTAYFVNTTPENLDKAVDLVTGWMLTAKITPEEYAREYQVVQRELEMDKGEPSWMFYHDMLRNRYRVSPARVPTIGYKQVIQGLSRDDVYAYYKLAYVPNNMIFVVTGNLEPRVMLQAVQKHVADAPPGRAFSHNIEDESPVEAPRTLVSTFPKLGQAKLQLAFPSIKLTHPDLYPLDLLATILGRGESSLLVEELRDRRQLVSTVAVYSDTPSYVQGTFIIDLELDTDKLAPATAATLELLEQIKASGVTPERLARAKTQVKTSRAFSLQTAEDIAESMASDLLSTGDPHFSDRYVERMQHVTSDQIKAVAARYFPRNRLLTTAMLPEEAVGPGGLAAAERMLRAAAPTTRPAEAPKPSSIVKVDLNDGTILLLKRVPTAPIATISLYSLGGLTAEDAATNGLGNLAMQTATRGTKSRSARQVAEFFDSIGGALSTSCTNNYWSWSAQCMKDDLPRAMEVFTDVVKNASFPDDETAAMKRRVLAAIESQDADWFAETMRFFRKTYFGPRNSPYQFMSIGTKANVQKFTTQQVRQWYGDKVLGGKRVLAIFGDIDIDKARTLAAAQFGGEKPPSLTKTGSGTLRLSGEIKHPSPPSIVIERVEVQKTDNPQAGVIIGFDSNYVVGDPDNFPLTVAKTMASGYNYPTGYIFETLRGQGLVYDAQMFEIPGRDLKHPGTIIAYAGCDPKNVNAVVDGIIENVARLQGTPADLQPQWFDRSKELIRTADALEHETPAAQAKTAALDELYGLGYEYHSCFDKSIKGVKIADVPAVAGHLLNRCVITVNTSRPEAVKIVPGARSFMSFRPVDLTPRGVQHDAGPAGR